MGPPRVVVLPPAFNRKSGIVERRKPILVRAFVAEPAVETLDVRVLDRLPGANELQRDAPRVRPLIEDLARKLRPVITHERRRQRPLRSQLL